jgi:hypothetical protein
MSFHDKVIEIGDGALAGDIVRGEPNECAGEVQALVVVIRELAGIEHRPDRVPVESIARDKEL